MAKKIYEDNGKEIKQGGGCLKVLGVTVAVLVGLGVVGNVIGLGTGNGTPSSTEELSIDESRVSIEETPIDEEVGNLTAEEQYQGILDEYTGILETESVRLVEEYKAEYPNNTEGISGLAELSNEKVIELAEISNEGVGEMADVLYNSGTGSYEEYEEWAGKLMDVYMEEGSKITDVYMDSAM